MNIFISYSKKNRPQVDSLSQDLKDLGHVVWFDTELIGGQSWWDQILAIIERCDLFVFALSPESLASYPCTLEYTYASQLRKRVLPILVADGVNTRELPPELSKIQWVDYRQMDRQSAIAMSKALNYLPAPEVLTGMPPLRPPVPIDSVYELHQQIINPAPMGDKDQSWTLHQIKELRNKPGETDTAIDLLRKLRERRDLLASHAAEIDSLLGNSRTIGSQFSSHSERIVDSASRFVRQIAESAQPPTPGSTRAVTATSLPGGINLMSVFPIFVRAFLTYTIAITVILLPFTISTSSSASYSIVTVVLGLAFIGGYVSFFPSIFVAIRWIQGSAGTQVGNTGEFLQRLRAAAQSMNYSVVSESKDIVVLSKHANWLKLRPQTFVYVRLQNATARMEGPWTVVNGLKQRVG
jgi:hypothetical protein